MACLPLTSLVHAAPRFAALGAIAAGRVLPKRRAGEAAIGLEQRAANQNERPLQQAQGIVRPPGVAATPARTHIHAAPARQSWMSARR